MALTVKQAKRKALELMLVRPIGRLALDQAVDWTNSPMLVRIIRDDGIYIQSDRDSDRRAVYSLPFSEKQKAYQFLSND